MGERNQEKLGWVGGWLRGLIRVFILTLIFFVRGKTLQAATGLLITCSACISIFVLSPRRYLRTSYRRPMVPVCLLLFIAIGWGVWSSGDPRQMGMNSLWSLLLLLSSTLPLWIVGDRRSENRSTGLESRGDH